MLTPEIEALGINKAMKVDPTSKTPYSDATQVSRHCCLLLDVSIFNF